VFKQYQAIEDDIILNNEDTMEPIAGGPNSANAEFVSVIFNSDPALYTERTFRETVRDY